MVSILRKYAPVMKETCEFLFSLWRDGRVAEGAPLLREYRVCSPIEGSNPSVSAIFINLINFNIL